MQRMILPEVHTFRGSCSIPYFISNCSRSLTHCLGFTVGKMIISIIYAKFNNTVFPVLILVISTVASSGCDMIWKRFCST